MDEAVGQGMLRVEHTRHFFVSNDKDRSRRDGGRRSHAYRLACHAPFSEKVTGAKNRHNGFLATLINYGELDAPFLDVHDAIRSLALREDGLFVLEVCNSSRYSD